MRIFTICRAHGLNHMRFHSWCPPEAAFSAADKAGFYLQAECSSWANQSTSLGDGKPFDNYLYQESERMVEAYGNHPSFCMMAYGNEPRGRNQNLFLTKFVNYWKEKDNRRLYLSGAGWPNLEANDYLSMSEPRIQRWGKNLPALSMRRHLQPIMTGLTGLKGPHSRWSATRSDSGAYIPILRKSANMTVFCEHGILRSSGKAWQGTAWGTWPTVS